MVQCVLSKKITMVQCVNTIVDNIIIASVAHKNVFLRSTKFEPKQSFFMVVLS